MGGGLTKLKPFKGGIDMVNKAYVVMTFSLSKDVLNLGMADILAFLEKYDEARKRSWYYKVDKYEWSRDELREFIERIKAGDHRIGNKESIFLLYLYTGKIYLIPVEGQVEDFDEAIRVKLFLNRQTYQIRIKQRYPELSFA
ncbi:MAG: hypothetical protein QW196_07750 [Sulfolobales archaeon]